MGVGKQDIYNSLFQMKHLLFKSGARVLILASEFLFEPSSFWMGPRLQVVTQILFPLLQEQNISSVGNG